MDHKARHMHTGRAGEEAAAVFLQTLGWRVLARNWRPDGPEKKLELDIVALDGPVLVFVEVKTRARAEGIPVYASFTPKKQRFLRQAAALYCTAHEAWQKPCRFDLLCAAAGPGGDFVLEHHRNVIEFGQTLGGGNAPWQPW